MEQSAEARVAQLETLVSTLRHDLRGAISAASLIAERLMQNNDPAIQRSATTIAKVVARVVATLNATYDQVPPREGSPSGPTLGA